MIELLHKLTETLEKESELKSFVQAEILETLYTKNTQNFKNKESFPFYQFTLGSPNPEAPVLFVVGGVHGLERIGAQLAWSFLKTTCDRLLWDDSLKLLLEKIRIVVLPLVNPYGYHHFTRANEQGVDLMRNSPIKAIDQVPFLAGGQTLSRHLPWYQGNPELPEKEIQLIVKAFEKNVLTSKKIIALDFHSGFGMKDRLWFPYSYKLEPFEYLAELEALTYLFEQAYPYHVYTIEPQSKGYLINGDLWDYLLKIYLAQNSEGVFIPLTLEMGSWSWVKKNPLQLFSKHGAFNPIKEHRQKRTYRRHHLMFDFMLRALFSNSFWSELSVIEKNQHHTKALKKWYT